MKKLLLSLFVCCFAYTQLAGQSDCEITLDIYSENNQHVCAGNSINDIIFNINSTNYTVDGLPPGIEPYSEYEGTAVRLSGSAPTGVYPYTVTAYGGCTLTATATGTIYVGSILLTNNDTQVVCKNQAIQPIKYKVATNYPYVYDLPSGVTYSTSNDTLTIYGTPNSDVVGNYSYYIDTYNGCSGNEPYVYGNVLVGVGSTPSNNGLTPVCKGDIIQDIEYKFAGGQAKVNGLPSGMTYSLTSAKTLNISGASSNEGLYTYTVTNDGGSCNQTSSITERIIVGGGFEGFSSLDKVCPGQDVYGDARFYIVGEYYSIIGLPSGLDSTYYMMNEGRGQNVGLGLRGQNQSYSYNTFSGSESTTGTYNYTITSTGYCSTQSSFVGVIIVKPMEVTVLTTNASSVNQCDGYAEAVIDEVGTAPFSYSWSDLNADNAITDACAGTYSVTVIDYNGCTATSKATIGVGMPAQTSGNGLQVKVLSYPTTTNLECDGVAKVKIEGGIPPYSLTFGGKTISDVTNYLIDSLCAGFYTVNVKDAQLNESAFTFVVAAPEYIFNSIDSSLFDSDFLDTLVSSAQSNCLINFDKIDSIKITDFKVLNNNTLNVTWSLYYQTSFVSMYVNYSYSLPGLYTLMFDLFCTNRSSGSVRGVDDLVIEEREITSGLATISEGADFTIYPNPADEELNIGLAAESTVIISDVTGKALYNQKLNVGINTINTASLASGVYIVSVTNNQGVTTKKLTKK
jgi:hypothetical protein